jgi:AraC-like DNA-binding protein
MENLNSLLAGLALSQLVFLASFIVFNFRHNHLAKLLVGFTLCLAGFLAGGIPVIAFSPLVDLALGSLAILTPAMLWLFALAFFKDELRVPAYGIGLILAYFSLRTVNATLTFLGYQTGQPGYYLGYLVPLLVMFGMSIHVVYLGFEGRPADLFEERRRLRLPFVISMGVVVLFTLTFSALSPLIQQVLSPEGSLLFVQTVTLVIYGCLFLWALVLNLAMFRFNTDAERLLQNPTPIDLEHTLEHREARPPEQEQKLMKKMSAAMDERKLYRERGVTIARLASELPATEQRLRTTINQTLGFRNFNQFLNHYRIREAARLLKNSDEPIANIAMEVGYNSLSAFNKAFKEIHRETPREFRAQSKLPD